MSVKYQKVTGGLQLGVSGSNVVEVQVAIGRVRIGSIRARYEVDRHIGGFCVGASCPKKEGADRNGYDDRDEDKYHLGHQW